MSDLLLENDWARSLIGGLGLPLPIPERLERTDGPWEERPIEGRLVRLSSGERSLLAETLVRAVAAAGGEPRSESSSAVEAAIAAIGPAFGRGAAADPSAPPHALVFDASGISEIGELERLYAFFHRNAGWLARSGRALVIGRPPEAASAPHEAATRRALEGFVRSLAKEIGRRGATANLIHVEAGAENRVPSLVRFLLSPRAAFVTAQPFSVTSRVPDGEPVWVRPLDRKVALVTGAARGIGAAIARRLVEEGASVVCLDRPEELETLTATAREVGGSTLLADVTASDAPATVAGTLRERHGGVDVVIHNAGVTRDRTIGRMTEAEWRQAVDVNLGAVLTITGALEGGLLRDGGRIVCLSSVAGIAGNVGQTNYAASKAGLIGFVRHEAEALAPRGITVNAVAPGFIETQMTAAVPLFVREAGRRLSALGQGGLPRDVAEAVTFLSSPGAAGLTGSVVRICGGAFLGA